MKISVAKSKQIKYASKNVQELENWGSRGGGGRFDGRPFIALRLRIQIYRQSLIFSLVTKNLF